MIGIGSKHEAILFSRGMAFLVILMLSACVSAAGGDMPPRALRPEEVLVVGNADSPDSVSLARFYAVARMIPQRNIINDGLNRRIKQLNDQNKNHTGD